MEVHFEQLVAQLNLVLVSPDVLQHISLLLDEQTDDSLPLLVTPSLHTLEYWAWEMLAQDSHLWVLEPNYLTLFQALSVFNRKVLFVQDRLDVDTKIALLVPQQIDHVCGLLERVQQSADANDPYIGLVGLWFDTLSLCVHEYPQLNKSSIITEINDSFADKFLMSDQFQVYSAQLQQSPVSQEIFTAKQLFYIRTCSLSLNAYFYTNPEHFTYTPDQVVERIGVGYLQIVQTHSHTVSDWSRELLACVTHLIGFMRAFLWWDGENGAKLKLLFPTEQILCAFVEAIVRIIDHRPLYKATMVQWANDETILLDSTLLLLMNIVQIQTINWFFRTMTQLPDILLTVAESSVYYRIYLCAYGILSEILTDEHLKELKITESVRLFFFNMLELAWHHPSKKYKQIPIIYLLRGFLNLSKNDLIQQDTAHSNKIPLLIDITDQYPIVFDIIWALSFNTDVQQQLRSSACFMSKLADLSKGSNDKQMRKAIDGILWNLESTHKDHPHADSTPFDIMISYSHKDKVLCKQLYEHLVQAGYRVWIDFDQMHGNVMDAMAQAIERAQTIIICMSEEYRRSNYCRAEAHYAFQRQLKIVPVLLQKHYKPDGWLLFLIGQLLYVDFTKYEFPRAMEMLFKELRAHTATAPVDMPVTTDSELPESIVKWKQAQVQEWLIAHELPGMAQLLSVCDGRSLVYLHRYLKHGRALQVLSLLQDDARRRTNANISLIELSCFQSLMDRKERELDAKTSKAAVARARPEKHRS